MNREASKKKITQQSFLAVFTALCLSAWFGILNVLASSSIELMDVFDFFPFFFSSGSTFYDSAVLFFCFLTSVTSFHVYHADGNLVLALVLDLPWNGCCALQITFNCSTVIKNLLKWLALQERNLQKIFFPMILQDIVFSFLTMFTC